jgi:hypothetical protein
MIPPQRLGKTPGAGISGNCDASFVAGGKPQAAETATVV